jgi:hypothetical protein
MRIENGVGESRYAEVNAEFQLATNSVTETLEHFVNSQKGKSWIAVVQQTPTGAGDYFFYIKNTGTVNMIFEGIDYRVASAEQVRIFLNHVGTTSGGSSVTAVNLNTGSSAAPSATIEAGNDITGLSGGSVASRLFLTSTETTHFNFSQDIVIAPGGTLALEAVAGSIQIDLGLHFYESSL